MWIQGAFGEAREDQRWAILCSALAASQGVEGDLTSPSYYTDLLDTTLEELHEMQQRKIENDLALNIGMNNRKFEDQLDGS